MQNQEFEVGDVVRLKGQRPHMPMHVTRVDSKGITCVWVDAYKRPQERVYPPEILTYMDN